MSQDTSVIVCRCRDNSEQYRRYHCCKGISGWNWVCGRSLHFSFLDCFGSNISWSHLGTNQFSYTLPAFTKKWVASCQNCINCLASSYLLCWNDIPRLFSCWPLKRRTIVYGSTCSSPVSRSIGIQTQASELLDGDFLTQIVIQRSMWCRWNAEADSMAACPCRILLGRDLLSVRPVPWYRKLPDWAEYPKSRYVGSLSWWILQGCMALVRREEPVFRGSCRIADC